MSAPFFFEVAMYYVYILQLNNGQLYTGYSSDLKRRMTEHTSGKVAFTSQRLPLKLIYYEAYTEEADARHREVFLKSSDGKRILKKQNSSFFSDLNKGSPC